MRIVKRSEFLKLTSVFAFSQSKVDEGTAFVLEEHLGRINRYGRPGPRSGRPVGLLVGFRVLGRPLVLQLESAVPLTF